VHYMSEGRRKVGREREGVACTFEITLPCVTTSHLTHSHTHHLLIVRLTHSAVSKRWTVFFIAVLNDSLQAVKLLLSYGTNTSTKDKHGRTALQDGVQLVCLCVCACVCVCVCVDTYTYVGVCIMIVYNNRITLLVCDCECTSACRCMYDTQSCFLYTGSHRMCPCC